MSMDLADILGVGASVASGGVLGLLGSAVGAVGKYFTRKQELVEADKNRQHELALIREQRATKAEETESEIRLVDAAASGEMRVKSYEMQETAGPTSQWANDLKTLFRPTLTLFLWLATGGCLMWVAKYGVESGLLTYKDFGELVRYIVYSVVFSAVTATVWWFGDRAFLPPGLSRR